MDQPSLIVSNIMGNSNVPNKGKHVSMSHVMRFPTLSYVRPAKAQTSLRKRAVWSEPMLVAWIFYKN